MMKKMVLLVIIMMLFQACTVEEEQLNIDSDEMKSDHTVETQDKVEISDDKSDAMGDPDQISETDETADEQVELDELNDVEQSTDEVDSEIQDEDAVVDEDVQGSEYDLTYTEGDYVRIIEVDDPKDHLNTHADYPDTAEAYFFEPETTLHAPIVMLPGMGLSHYLYIATPDGRKSWAELFSEAGYPVFVLNQKKNIAPKDAPPDGVTTSSWELSNIWSKWGFGAEEGVPYDNVRFPVAQIDELMDTMPLYVRRGGGIEQDMNELLELLEKFGPAYVMVHSAAGETGFEVVKSRPELFKALVVVEPVGCPTVAADAPQVDFLSVYGDYIAARGQTGRYEACKQTVKLVGDGGHTTEMIDYPAINVFGNTHLMMQDNNNHTIATDIMNWIEK